MRTNVKFIRADIETLADRTLSEKSIKHCKTQCKNNMFHIHTNKMQLASGEPPAFTLHTDIQTYRHSDIQTYRHTDYRHTYRHTYIHIHTHTYIYRYTHIYIYTHTHTHTHTCTNKDALTHMLRIVMFSDQS